MQQPAYLSTLTPLRGIAALLVVIFHASLFIGPLIPADTSGLIGTGWLWVDFFFVLSGFVLTHVYGHSFRERITWSSYRGYLLARFARVYPLHLATLLVAVALTLWLRSLAGELMPIVQVMFDLKAVPASLLLVQSLHLFATPPLNTPSWSLSTEWWVYMLFPLLVRPLFRLSARGKGVALAGIAVLYLTLIFYVAPRFGNLIFAGMGMHRGATLDLTADWGYFRCLAGFGLGMVLYRFYPEGRGLPLLRQDRTFLGCAAAVLLTMHFQLPELVCIGLFPFLILTSACNQGKVKEVLMLRPLQRLGDYSFSVYMVHMPLVYLYWGKVLHENPNAFARLPEHLNPDYLHNWCWSLLLLAATVMVSALTYHLVEVPARQYLTRHRVVKADVPAPVAA
jgi:peptidoglycan/LPS O-acetylase OafA/YrhL